jgi:transposase
MTPLKLSDRQRTELEFVVTHTPWAKERCRAQALLWLDEGATVEQVAESLLVTRQTVYNWAHRLQERPGPDLRGRRADAPRPGRPRAAHGDVDSRIARVIDSDPRQFGYHATVWTAPVLRHSLQHHHAIAVSRKTISRAIERLGIRWKRPRHQLSLRPETWRQSTGGSNAGSRAASAPCS